ncbi:MAG: sigma-70 family RNA polymerase sigma factor [Planctomycetota bacterium]|jgi:RNA polymerase sigma factor (TIGR02999 family)
MSDVTRILNAIEHGDEKASEKLLPLVYEELRLLAAQKMSHEKPGQTLQATALVHEAYIRLVGEKAQDWKSRRHFFRAAAEAMRRILIDNARRKKRLKHGSKRQRIELDGASLKDSSSPYADELIALDEVLAKLSKEDRTKAEVVKLRYFAGLSIEQTANILEISPRTVKRYWAYARAWLLCEIE